MGKINNKITLESLEEYIDIRLKDICLGLKQFINIGDRYMEFLSALIYITYEFQDVFLSDDFIFTDLRIFDHFLEELRKKEELKNLFINIVFNNSINTNKFYTFLKIFEDIKTLIKTIRCSVEEDKAKLAKAYEKCIIDAVETNKKSFLKYNFYTPKEVVEIIVDLLNIQNGHKIYDPFCGTGSFFVESSKNKEIFAYGEGVDISTYNICMTNLWLHDIKNKEILENNIILENELLNADIAMSNPPFVDKMEVNERVLYNYYKYGVHKTKIVSGYIKYLILMLENINANGKMAIIMPNGFLFKKLDQDVRVNLLNRNWIDAIISLPENLFIETRIPIIILVIDKNKKDKNILFIDASNEFESKRRKNILTKENQEKIISTYREYKEIDGYSYVAGLDEIGVNYYDLSVKKYVKKIPKKDNIDYNILKTEIEMLEKENKKIQNEILEIIKDLY